MRVAVHGLSDFGYALAIRTHDIGNEVIAVDPASGELPPVVPGPDYRISANDTIIVLGTVQELLREVRK